MKDKNSHYNISDIVRSFRWLGHNGYGFTELNAFHNQYKPGKENFNYNRENGFLAKIWHVRSERHAVAFIKRFHKDHTCCYGNNPRPAQLKNKRNFVRSARESDIKIVMNFYLDFDFTGQPSDDHHMFRLVELINEIELYLGKEKIASPVRAFTGNGYHLLFPLPAIKTDEHPDIKDRLQKFQDIINNEFSEYMRNIGVKLDNTMDLRRVAKMYGSKKPYNDSRLSRFYGKDRIEDHVLREYLLGLDTTPPLHFDEHATALDLYEKLPEKFRKLIQNNSAIQQLWNNTGKTGTADISRSGYDFSLVKACLKNGITDLTDLFAILKFRPDGAYQKSNKGDRYILRTIGNALYK